MIDITIHVNTVITVFVAIKSYLIQTEKVAFVERLVTPTGNARRSKK